MLAPIGPTVSWRPISQSFSADRRNRSQNRSLIREQWMALVVTLS